MVRKLRKVGLPELGEAYEKVLLWFFAFPTKEVSLSDLAKNVEISKITANRMVSMLASEGFLKLDFLGKLWRIRCDQKHYYNVSKKVPYNLMMIYESGIIQEIGKEFPDARTVVLFGSYRKGDDTDESDIDIAVEILGSKFQIVEFGILPKFGFRSNVRVNVHVFSRAHVNASLFANIANGIVLDGFLEVKP